MRIFLKFLLSIILLISALSPGFAQKKDKKDQKKEDDLLGFDEKVLKSDSLPNLVLELSEEELNLTKQEEKQRQQKKKKKKKNIYFGIKTSGGFSKKVNNSYTDLEVFRFIDGTNVMKNPYQKEIHYFDPKTKRIKTLNYFDFVARQKKGQKLLLLHGQYIKYRDRIIRAEGFYYKGTKHGKWMEYDKNGIVLEKIKYDLGNPKDSKITYYDTRKTQIKEILPIMHGRIQGTYYKFYQNGVTEASGKYENNRQVGLWEYWFDTRQRYKHVMYPTKWWDNIEPTRLREWDQKGNMVYDIDRGGEIKH